MPTDSFLDPFFFAVLVLVATLAFADFLLGQEGRKRVKEHVGDWWIYLEDSSYAGLGADDAARIQDLARRCLGPIRSFRFWVSAFVGACVLFPMSLQVVSSLMLGDPIIPGSLENLLEVHQVLVDRGAFLFLANTLVPVISLVVTLGFLQLMASTSSLLLLFLLIVGDTVAALTISVATVMIVQSHRTWDVFDFGNVFDQLIWLAGGMLTLAPTILHVVLVMLFMLSKLTTPILKKPVNLILLRLHESEKGVFSLIGVAVGTLAKLVQEGLKLM